MSQFLTTPDQNGDKRLLCAYKSEINFLTEGLSLTLEELRQCIEERKIELEERVANLECSILHNYLKEHRRLDMDGISTYVDVNEAYDAYITEELAPYFGPDSNVEAALRTLEEIGKIEINESESGYITTIKVND